MDEGKVLSWVVEDGESCGFKTQVNQKTDSLSTKLKKYKSLSTFMWMMELDVQYGGLKEEEKDHNKCTYMWILECDGWDIETSHLQEVDSLSLNLQNFKLWSIQI